MEIILVLLGLRVKHKSEPELLLHTKIVDGLMHYSKIMIKEAS